MEVEMERIDFNKELFMEERLKDLFNRDKYKVRNKGEEIEVKLNDDSEVKELNFN